MAEIIPVNPYRDELEQIERERIELLEAERLSLPPHAGQLAIFVSGANSKGKRTNEDYPAFMEEAEAFQAEQAARYADVVIVEHVGKEAIAAALRNPEIGGVAYIGHGSLPSFFTENGMITWSDTWRARDHLKREVWQASCGHIPSLWQYGIPFGQPLMSRPSGLRAAVGAILPDHAISYDQLLHPVFTDDGSIVEQLDVINREHLGEKDLLAPDGQIRGRKKC